MKISVIAATLFAVVVLPACHSLTIKTLPAADGLPAQRCVHERVKFVFKFVDVMKCEPLPAATSGADTVRP